MLDKISQKMCELGFTSYEAKAYVSLLQQYPATRYELSKNSGVPRSAIYDVINRLESYGAVSVISTQPEKYVPLPPEQFLKMLEQRFSQKIEVFRKSLSEIKIKIEPEQLWNLSGYQNLVSKAREMIQTAQESIYLSAWRSEVLELEKYLKEAEARKIKVVIFSFTQIPDIGFNYSYQMHEKELEEVWDHKIVLVRDHEELLMGEVNKIIEKKVAWTLNKAIVQIAENYIILDITLFGIRAGVDVRNAVIEAHPGELGLLDKMLKERFPHNPMINLDFSQYQIKEKNYV
jgi:HTH-type transcriptional regulator, sugar sensing transcriptional regulator